MSPEAIARLLREKLPEAVRGEELRGPDSWVELAPEGLRPAATFLRHDPRLLMDSLLCLAGVDWKDRLEVVYHLFSMKHRHRIVLKVKLPREGALLDSVQDLWPTANWHERECFDILGIRFRGHPDLRRILLPEDWEGYPLRKDYRFPESYHGMEV